ncbi:hypothetical protein ABEY63_25530 [Priestia aryabhattai]|uniref:hypothetical protein n=1 Tax=Priestia aryabhattai TaxID=412384 RepID=UPI003D2C1065
MRIKKVEYVKESKSFNMVEFHVTFINIFEKEIGPIRVNIWGDSGTVLPEWCTSFREEILLHKSAVLPLIYTSFTEKY